MPSLPSVPAMGMFPSLETAGAQAILLLLFLFMMVKTFMPRDEVVQAS